MEFRNYLHSKRNSSNFNELNEALKSRKIDPRNWLSSVDEKKHRDVILDYTKKFLNNYFDSFEILVKLTELQKLHNEFVEKISINYRKLGLKFPLKSKFDW